MFPNMSNEPIKTLPTSRSYEIGRDQITMRIDRRQLKRLRAIAEVRGTSAGELIRHIVDHTIDEIEAAAITDNTVNK